ncbi:MAG: Zn-dependent oligopeptidase [Candidatus Thorarchaeota archaeon]|nr:MAG: Zn-dependent oligopeptidase [Candidatus Thorarchaeota archaeon]
MTNEGVIRRPNWQMDPDTMESTAEEVIDITKKALDNVAKTVAGEESIETLQEFEGILASAVERLTPITFLKYVSTDKAQRDVGHKVEQDAEKFFNEIWTRSDIYELIARLESKAESFGEEERMLLKKVLEEFRHNGANLDQDIRMEFLEIANNISVRESDFNRTLNEITETVPFTAEELEGVPADVYEELEKDVDRYLLPLHNPVYLGVVQFAKDPETRMRMEAAYFRRGGEENSKRLADTLALRERQAKLLGYSNFAEYAIKRKMAKTPERVFEFMHDLKEKLAPFGEKEVIRMRQLKSEEVGVPFEEVDLKLWDMRYYHHRLMKEEYSLDQNEIKKYFPMDSVVDGVLKVYQKVLNLQFEEVMDGDKWHDDVREFKVIDKTNGETLGVFFLDLYPREGKYSHYAVFSLLERRVKDGTVYIPINSMVANFQKPTKSQPSLLPHSQVVTFFHEFGHLMHGISNKASYSSFGLDGVLPDFIEVPSMMFENWAWKEEVLSLLSGHYEDREKKLPADLLEKMVQVKLLNIGTFQLRQVFFALIDMRYHTEQIDDTTKEFVRYYNTVTGFEMEEGITPDAGFAHLMGGYQAGYYGYLWSQVFAEDLFTRFDENGFMDDKTGLQLREKVLAPGGSRDPDALIRDFLGRESNNEAFLKSLGLDK